MSNKHHMPQLFLKILWTRRTWGEYKIKSTNYVSYSKLNHRECREAKQLKRGCVGVHVTLETRWRMCTMILPLPMRTPCQGMPEHTRAWARSYLQARQLPLPSHVQTAVQALGFLCLGFLYLFQHSLQNHPVMTAHQLHSHFLFPIPLSSFSIIHNGQRRTRWGKKKFS